MKTAIFSTSYRVLFAPNFKRNFYDITAVFLGFFVLLGYPINAFNQDIEISDILLPNFTIEKTQFIAGGCQFTSSPLNGFVGQVVNYRIVVTNVSEGDITASFSDPGCDPGTISPAPTPVILTTGQSITYTCRHLLTSADLLAGSYSNQADVNGETSNTVTVNMVGLNSVVIDACE